MRVASQEGFLAMTFRLPHVMDVSVSLSRALESPRINAEIVSIVSP